MTELRTISANHDRAAMHVILVHGLSGDICQTWTSRLSDSEVFWPPWLEDDIPGVAVWLIGYPAARTNWRGYGTSIPDRANSILARLLAEPSLTSGTIVFVCHSLGGLVVKQVLRSAKRDEISDARAKQFLDRVKKVVFLGTPHRGSLLATVAVLMIRSSEATDDLRLGSAHLKDLNEWYRRYCQDCGLQNLLLIEAEPARLCGLSLPKWIGTVVSQESADSGLQETPIYVDKSHSTICKPATKNSEVYVLLKEFLSKQSESSIRFTSTKETLERHTKEFKRLSTLVERQADETAKPSNLTAGGSAVSGTVLTFIDAEVGRRLDRLRKCRVFTEFDAIEEARTFVASLEDGGALGQASKEQKEIAFAWCARILSIAASDEASKLLDRVETAGSEAVDVARGLVRAARGDLQGAIGKLCSVGSPIAFGAAFACVLRSRGIEEANKWLRSAGLSFADIDCDAKLFYIGKCLENGGWDVAFDVAKDMEDLELEQSPGLMLAVADAYLLQTVPIEFRNLVLKQGIPFDVASFPLRGNPEALGQRRRAGELYLKLFTVANSLGLPRVAELLDDKALWLRLVDPEYKADARAELEQNLKSPKKLMRHLGLGLQFGVEIDLQRAEAEVDRQTTLSGGMSVDAAYARFVLALNAGSPAGIVKYMTLHRQQLQDHLDWRGIAFVEIEALARSGQLAKAEERLKEAIQKGLSEPEVARLRLSMAGADGGDLIADRLAAYRETGDFVELRILVVACEEAEDWSNACQYGRELLDVTGDLSDARRLVISLHKFEQYNEALGVLEAYPALHVAEGSLRVLRAQILFESGRLNEASEALRKLGESRDSPECRQLRISLAVASGDWESLQSFVEEEWNARSERTPEELLRAGHIAGQIGAARGKELVRLAAARCSDDPSVLTNCFHVAISAGWEDNVEVHGWIQKAADQSAEDGPVQMVSIEDILEKKPDWERRESTALNLLEKGEAPIFVAGQLLNRSLLGLYLMPALSNLAEPDVRRRSTIHAFSGARRHKRLQPKVLALDPTALMTLEFLGLLDVCMENFESIIVPHGTLSWLLEEKARIVFHQPSRVVAARELRQMIADRQLHACEGSNVASDGLVDEVGSSLSTLLAEASSAEHRDTRQRLVVCGRPVYKANSLMQKEADLSGYENFLCSGIAVVNMLARSGVLTSQEEQKAHAELSVREARWPREPQIADGAALYLDDTSVAHLQHLGLLSKIHLAGATAFVSASKVDETVALIAYDTKAVEVVELVEKLRIRLREGIKCGKVRLGELIRGEHDEIPGNPASHPTVDLLRVLANADAGVVDDRFVNQHGEMSQGTASRPLLTTIDLLDILVELGALSAEQRQGALTKLRQANFALTPVTAEDLNALIVNCAVDGETLLETAEIKSIRENIERIQMSNFLQLPKEHAWLSGVTQACLACLKAQWTGGFSEATAIARSDWLLPLTDPRAWTHRFEESADQLKERFRNWIVLLATLSTNQQQSVKEAYWNWLDSRVLGPIQEEDPETYRYLVQWAKECVAASVEACERSLEDKSE